MKATLSFDLPEDRIEFEQASHAGSLAGTVSALDTAARNFLKHDHGFKTPDEVLSWVREQIDPAVRDLAHGEVLS